MFLVTYTYIRIGACGCCFSDEEEEVNKLVNTIEQVKEIMTEFEKKFNRNDYSIQITEFNEIDLNKIVGNFKKELLELSDYETICVGDIERPFKLFSERSDIHCTNYVKRIDEKEVRI